MKPPVMRTLDELDVENRRVLLRAYLNVPLQSDEGTVNVADDTRIRAALETIEQLRARHARIVLLSHLGRPHGRDPALSMRPVADRLSELLGCSVGLAPAVVGDESRPSASASATARSCCWRTCATSRARPTTIPSWQASWPSSPTCMSTTPSAPRTAPTPAPREWPICFP